MFRTVDRYLIREIALPFLLALVVLTFVLEVPVILREAETLIARGASWRVIINVLLTLLPQALSLTIPMAVLFGILVGFGRLSADREFIALQACGVSFLRLLRPVILVAVVGTAATAYEIIVALPENNQRFREIVLAVMADRVESEVKPRVFFDDFPQRVIYAREVPTSGGWKDVFLADLTRPGEIRIYLARIGQIRIDHVEKLVQLELIDGTAHTTSLEKPEVYQRDAFESLVISLDPQTVFRRSPERGPPEMTLAELRAAIAEADKRGDPAYQERFMTQYKLSLPATCPILALIGLALGASSRKDGRLASFVLGFGVIIVFYVLLYGARAFAMGGRLDPVIAPWIPNLVMAVVALVLTAWRIRAADRPLPVNLAAVTSTPRLPRIKRRGRAGTPANRTWLDRLLDLPLPRPRVLDIYVGREYLRVFVLGVVGLLGIFYVSTFIDLADKLFRGQATTGMLLRFFAWETPRYVYFVIPMAVLVAVLVTVGVMTKNSELQVMRACGISLYRSAVPLFLAGCAASAALFGLQERVLTRSNREADRLNGVIRGYPPLTRGLDRRWIVATNGDVYHYDLFEPEANRFTRLWIYEIDEQQWRMKTITHVNEAVLLPDGHVGDAGGVGNDEGRAPWEGRGGWRRELDPSGPRGAIPPVAYTNNTTRTLSLEGPEYFKNDTPIAEQMTYGELQAYVERLEASGSNAVPYMVSLHRKIAFPLVTVIMTVLAVPFAVTTGRRGALYGVGVGIVLAIVYWIALSVSAALGAGGVLLPVLAAWAPNILFGAAAVYLLLTVRT